MKDVHQLALILVKPLYLHIENGSGIYVNSIVLLNVRSKADLVFVL